MPDQNLKQIVESFKGKLKKPLVILDIETTGLNVQKDEIVTITLFRIEPDLKSRLVEIKCKPSIPISADSAKVHGITNEMVASEKPFSEYANKIYNFIKGCSVGGYNLISYDVKIIERQLIEQGIDKPFEGIEIYDSFIVYKDHSPRKLANAYDFYTSKELKDAHDATADVLATTEIISAQLDKEKIDLSEIITRIDGAKKQAGIERYIFEENGIKYINFGKHKGKELSKVDSGFRAWVIKGDFPQAVKDAFKGAV